MTSIQKQVWDHMLNTQFDLVYWGKKAFWLSARLKVIRLTAAVIGCAALVTFFTGPEWGPLKSMLGLLGAVLAFYLSTFDLQGALYKIEETQKKYSLLYGRFEHLWQEISVGQLAENEILAKLAPLTEDLVQIEEPNVVDSKRLKRESFDEICAARGLKKPDV